jgi:hypothetical protein
LGKGPERDQVVLPGAVSCPSGRGAALRGGSGSSGGAARSRAGRSLGPSGRFDRLAAGGRALRSSTSGQRSSSVSTEVSSRLNTVLTAPRSQKGGRRSAGGFQAGFDVHRRSGPAPRGEAEDVGARKSSWLLIRAEGAGQILSKQAKDTRGYTFASPRRRSSGVEHREEQAS